MRGGPASKAAYTGPRLIAAKPGQGPSAASPGIAGRAMAPTSGAPCCQHLPAVPYSRMLRPRRSTLGRSSGRFFSSRNAPVVDVGRPSPDRSAPPSSPRQPATAPESTRAATRLLRIAIESIRSEVRRLGLTKSRLDCSPARSSVIRRGDGRGGGQRSPKYEAPAPRPSKRAFISPRSSLNRTRLGRCRDNGDERGDGEDPGQAPGQDNHSLLGFEASREPLVPDRLYLGTLPALLVIEAVNPVTDPAGQVIESFVRPGGPDWPHGE
jgi:hypothetical protein